MKKDFSPTLLDFGPVQIFLARHFGFCYGVENAIDIAFRTVAENPGKRIFLLSEMIHNPQVNADLHAHGINFLHDTSGKEIIPLSSLSKEDIVLIPAFGTTLEMEATLHAKGIQTEPYNTTCPFVEKVWNRSEVIAKKNYTIVIHGKPKHEETRATFSHAAAGAPAVIVNDMREAELLATFITGEKPSEEFYKLFKGQYNEGFDVTADLKRIGVVNQTTMLASDTQAIADYLKQVILKTLMPAGGNPEDYFADTRDTLCYATHDNQTAVSGMLETPADLALVVGGYNSSNTSHLVELCELKLPTYFIKNSDHLLPGGEILHYNLHQHEEKITAGFLPDKKPVKILVTSGASCPDAIVEGVIERVLNYFPDAKKLSELLDRY